MLARVPNNRQLPQTIRGKKVPDYDANLLGSAVVFCLSSE